MSAARGGAMAGALGPDAAASLRDAAKVIAWSLLLYGGVVLVGTKLQAKSVGALAVQMVLAEWGAGRLGVAWSDPHGDVPSYGDLARRAGRGALLGVGAAAAALGFALTTGALRLHKNAPDAAELGLGVLTATFLAARDELLFRGLVLRAFRRAAGPVGLVLFCGAASAAAEYGLSDGTALASPARLAITFALGAAFAGLWLVDRGGWLALGAHVAWTTATGTLIRGGLLDLRAATTSWGGGDAGVLGSVATLAVVAPLAVAATLWATRRSRPSQGDEADRGHR